MKNVSRRGQISIEILYSVGVLLLIFIMLTGITFERRMSVESTRDLVGKKDTCMMISNKLNSVSVLGDGYSSDFKTIHRFDVYDTGLLIVGDVGVAEEDKPKEVEAVCTFNGVLFTDKFTGDGGAWSVVNNGGVLTIE
tara:strand:- start:1589 stop:2002 length:414 start_codon:yes stop_codon:yes gene_type:complete